MGHDIRRYDWFGRIVKDRIFDFFNFGFSLPYSFVWARWRLATTVYEAAKAGDLEKVIDLMGEPLNSNGLLAQMAVMGAQDAIGYWALRHGGCIRWAFKEEPGARTRCVAAGNYGKNISMLKGPGEVARGTFASRRPDDPPSS